MFRNFPIIQAPMAGAQDAKLTIAVCRAGAIGSLPAGMLTASQLDTELRAIKQTVGERLYNVNFFAHKQHAITEQQRRAWLALLQPYLDKYGISSADMPTSAGRYPFDEQALALVEQHRPPIVSFHFGLPAKPLLDKVKATGAKIWASATTVAEAVWLENQGVDAIIAQGLEAGGHRGTFLRQDLQEQMGIFALLPNIVAAVQCPVIAAGGISNRAQVLAVKTLGASAAQIGSAFLLAEEANTSAAHRAALANGQTAITNLFSGGLARGIVKPWTQTLGNIHPQALPFPYCGAAIQLLKSKAEAQQQYDFSAFWAGQNARFAQAGAAAEILARLQV